MEEDCVVNENKEIKGVSFEVLSERTCERSRIGEKRIKVRSTKKKRLWGIFDENSSNVTGGVT